MKELKKRWQAETPHFFKKVIKIGVSLGVIGATIATAPISLPASIIAIGGYLSTAGFMAAAVGKLAKI